MNDVLQGTSPWSSHTKAKNVRHSRGGVSPPPDPSPLLSLLPFLSALTPLPPVQGPGSAAPRGAP